MFNKYFRNLIIFTAYLAAQQVEIENIRPIAHLDLGNCNDVWGYTAPNGHEFALVGHRTGTYIFDVSTNPHDPIEVGFIPGTNSTWRDLKTHGYYCYVVNESGGGMDIISLEDPFNPYKVGSYTSSTATAHNMFIADGYAYLVGSAGASAQTNSWHGIIILELSDPENPTELGRWEETYIHDIYVKNDTAYACDIYNGSLAIIDVSDKTNPTTMLVHNYSNYGCHAVWITDDSRYAVTADEENGGFIYIHDIQDFNNINMVATWYPNEPEVQNKSAHNVLIKDDLLYVSYYVYGTRIVDISDPYNPTEVGYYDWYPGQQGLYNGNWGVYPYTENGLIYSTDYSGNGFFVMSYPYMGEIEFEEVSDTENNVDPITLSATINESSEYSVDYSTLMLYWGLNGMITDSTALTMSGDSYIGSITPTGQNGTMHYYVAFNTMTDERVTKPYGAPYASFTFNIGTDSVFPEIELITDLADQFYPSGSYEVVSIASDNIGISMVELFWQVGNGEIQTVACTELNDPEYGVIYEGVLSYEDISPGTEIIYWSGATDASNQSNQSESEQKHFYVSDNYVLGDFENEEALDRWDLGGWGRQYVNDDIQWALNDSPGGLYSPNVYNACYFIETLDLTQFNQAYLQFTSAEMLYDGDYGYLQIKRGNNPGWSTLLTVNGYIEIVERNVSLNSFMDESELYIRLLMTSNSTDESQGWFVDDIFLVLNQDMPPNVNTASGIINLPDQIQLYPNYPNPFNPITNIAFSLAKYSLVDLKIVDIKGRQICQLLNNDFAAGRHGVSWNGTNDLGAAVGSGIYFMVLRAEGKVLSQKLSLIR
jgi:choice-of-anchor B domain-containing protein